MKIDRQGLIEAGIAGSTTGIFFGSVVIATRLTTDAGDILGFFGAAFGAGVAVLGALFVERVKISNELARRRESLEMSVAAVVLIYDKVQQHPGGEEIVGYLIAAEQALSVFIRSKDAYQAQDMKLVGVLEALAYWVPTTQAFIREVVEKVDRGAILIDGVEQVAREIASRGLPQWFRVLAFDREWSGAGMRLLRQEAPHLLEAS